MVERVSRRGRLTRPQVSTGALGIGCGLYARPEANRPTGFAVTA